MITTAVQVIGSYCHTLLYRTISALRDVVSTFHSDRSFPS